MVNLVLVMQVGLFFVSALESLSDVTMSCTEQRSTTFRTTGKRTASESLRNDSSRKQLRHSFQLYCLLRPALNYEWSYLMTLVIGCCSCDVTSLSISIGCQAGHDQ